MTRDNSDQSGHEIQRINASGRSSVVLVCEHASPFIPPEFSDLGLSAETRQSHAVWDPGAMAVAEQMARGLDAVLIAASVSRLVYDCNRPPEAPDAMPAKSEVIEVPGNVGLTAQQRETRVQTYYAPFRDGLAQAVAARKAPVLVTIHSFTPVYHGKPRGVEIGILHDSDSRLADAMLHTAAAHTGADVQRNQPYGPEDGVTHTLKEHGVAQGHLNVMIEIRNDLIKTQAQQDAMGRTLSDWLVDAFAQTRAEGHVSCVA